MNPFSWLPKTGKTVRIPGGYMYCQNWQFTQTSPGKFEGEIILRFACSQKFYEEGMAEPQQLPGDTPALPYKNPFELPDSQSGQNPGEN